VHMAEETKTSIDFPKFGECTYGADEVIDFPWGLPGFPNLVRWLPLNLESQKNFIWLQSLDDVNVALPAIDPWLVFEDYDPKLPAYAFTSLDVKDASDFATLCVVVVTPNASEMTINLAAPVIVNLRTRKGRQILLEGTSYSARELIPRKAAEAAGSKTA
jgi:flagellar assembly factor FliW